MTISPTNPPSASVQCLSFSASQGITAGQFPRQHGSTSPFSITTTPSARHRNTKGTGVRENPVTPDRDAAVPCRSGSARGEVVEAKSKLTKLNCAT